MNPLRSAMTNNTQQSCSNIKDLYRQFMSSKNPMQLLLNLSQSNPQLAPVVQMLKQGGSPEQVFKMMAKNMGVNPDAFIKQITG